MIPWCPSSLTKLMSEHIIAAVVGDVDVTRMLQGGHMRLASLIFLITLLMGSTVAQAHGEHDWIRQHGYRSLDGYPCCGIDDCYKIKPEEVSIQGDMYHVRRWGASFPINRTLPSEDRYFWMCADEKDVRCFFAPLGGV